MDIKKRSNLLFSKHIDRKYGECSTKYLQNKISFVGVRTPIVREISKDIFEEICHLSKKEIFKELEKLMDGKYEEVSLALYCSYMLRKEFEKEDFYIFHSWIEKYINNWANCDELCNRPLGYLFLIFPELVEKTKSMAKENVWLRRSAYVSLIPSIKKGNNHDFAFDLLKECFEEKEALAQKGAGWLLGEIAKVDEERALEFIFKNRDKLPKTTLVRSLKNIDRDKKIFLKNIEL